MSDNFDGKLLSVGDKVIVISSSWGVRVESVGTIVKKTPTGLLDVDYGNKLPTRFRATGSAYQKSEPYSRNSVHLECYTEDRALQIEERKKRNTLVNWLKSYEYDKLTLEELEKVYTVIKDCRGS